MNIIKNYDTVIVGGGISGLAAAYYLTQKDQTHKIIILESSRQLGGKIQTDLLKTESGDFLLEKGPDSYVAYKKEATELARELNLESELIGTQDQNRKIFILKNKRLKTMPDGMTMMIPTKIWPFVTSTLLSPFTKLRMGLDLFVPRIAQSKDMSLAEFISKRLGSGALENLAEPLLSGFLNASPERQSLHATMPQLVGMEKKYRSLTLGMLASRFKKKKVMSKPGPSFLSFRQGMGSLTQNLEKYLENQDNIQVFKNARVSQVRNYNSGYLINQNILAKNLIITTPAPVASKLLFLSAPKASAKLKKLRTISTGSAYLGFKGLVIPKGFGIVVPRSENKKHKIQVNAVTFVSNKLEHRAPKGCTLIRVFFGGSKTPHMMNKAEPELKIIILKQLKKILNFENQKLEPIFTKIYTYGPELQQYDVGHLELLKQIKAELPGSIKLIGAPYDGGGVPDCIRQAKTAAKASRP